ncbi:MAG: bacteriohemerythrin [Comamonadaceae bacterium]|nr:bacteriohemerythrin [Comamonadaceae bacterium]
MNLKWETYFETGIAVVDQQHRGLVDIINEAAPGLALPGGPDMQAIGAVLDRLFDYAASHFKTEEDLMTLHKLDARYVAHHCAIHAKFVDQVVGMRTLLSSDGALEVGPSRLRYLTSWLTIHILDEDRRFARHVALVEAGESASGAYEIVAKNNRSIDPARAALETALGDLYVVLGEHNKTLQQANAKLQQARDQLEMRVQERTNELSGALEQMKLTQSQLLQSEKMAAVGQLAAGVAHEINNPIGFVNSNLGSLKHYVAQLLNVISAYEAMETESSPLAERQQHLAQARAVADLDYMKADVVNLLNESVDGLERVKKIVQDLKDFSRVDQAEWQDADLNAGLESTLNVIAHELKYRANVVKHFAPLPLLRCLPSQLNQVFMNLLLNAAQALEGPGEINITTGFSEDTVWIEIRDNGKGIPTDLQKRIFEPFFTTKPVGKGTGLGLAIAFDIVQKKHGGRIEVDSAPGQGSTFRINLPRHSAQSSPNNLG